MVFWLPALPFRRKSVSACCPEENSAKTTDAGTSAANLCERLISMKRMRDEELQSQFTNLLATLTDELEAVSI